MSARRHFGRDRRPVRSERWLTVDREGLDDAEELLVRIDGGLLDLWHMVRQCRQDDGDEPWRERDQDARHDLEELPEPV